MKISVRLFLPLFALMLALVGQIMNTMQIDDIAVLVEENCDADMLAIDLNDDPDLLSQGNTASVPVTESTLSLCATSHEHFLIFALRSDARAPPRV